MLTDGYRITREDLRRWCSVPAESLRDRIDSRVKLVVHPDKEYLARAMCDALAEELVRNNRLGKATRWILPCHKGQFRHLVERINRERISMENVHIFHMDDFLDWQGRPYPVRDAFTSCRGISTADLYDQIDPELNVPPAQRHVPDYRDPDAMDRAIEDVGGIDTLVGGVGCKGMVAFCEAPRSPYHRISLEEYAASKTRIVTVHDDTIVAYAEREFGGCYDAVPPMAVTIGMKSMLRAKRALFVVATGAWKQTLIRVAMFSPATTEYPVTILTNGIADCTIYLDETTADHPLSRGMGQSALIDGEEAR